MYKYYFLIFSCTKSEINSALASIEGSLGPDFFVKEKWKRHVKISVSASNIELLIDLEANVKLISKSVIKSSTPRKPIGTNFVP